jgi:hypothetical protein
MRDVPAASAQALLDHVGDLAGPGAEVEHHRVAGLGQRCRGLAAEGAEAGEKRGDVERVTQELAGERLDLGHG